MVIHPAIVVAILLLSWQVEGFVSILTQTAERTTRRHQLWLLSSTVTEMLVEEQQTDLVNETHPDETNQQELQAYLKRSAERSLDEFIETQAPSWISDPHQQQQQQDESSTSSSSSSLPFSCTGCGNCCRTQGTVYLEPSDIRSAARVVGAPSLLEFCQTYASHYLLVDNVTSAEVAATTTTSLSTTNDHEQDDLAQLLQHNKVWILLKEQQQQDGCIFLNNDTNACQIYEARPVQCRTYPFWPQILQNPQLWNAECRRMDERDDIDETDGADDDDGKTVVLPRWTPEAGGCEGMRPLNDSNHDGNTADSEDAGVPIRDACRQLMDYTLADQRFPHRAEEVPMSPSIEL